MQSTCDDWNEVLGQEAECCRLIHAASQEIGIRFAQVELIARFFLKLS